jgi:hypothetical protein
VYADSLAIQISVKISGKVDERHEKKFQKGDGHPYIGYGPLRSHFPQ